MSNPAFIRRTISRLTSRTLLPLAATVVVFGLCGGNVEAGIVTSMSSDRGMSAAQTDDYPGAPSKQSEHSELLNFKAHPSGLFELPQNSGGTSSTSTTSSSGPTQSLAAATDIVLLGGLNRSGWITQEAVQVLPPLMPSGLFRPPCA